MQDLNRLFREKWAEGPALADPILYVAASGGADSMALLEVALASPFPVQVLHLHHGIRKAADQDAHFVRAFCQDRGIPYQEKRLSIPSLAQARGLSEELCGREERYLFFESVLAHSKGSPVLLTGHHLEDQAETVLFHLLRGAGPDGVAGMEVWARRPLGEGQAFYHLFRPFLSVRKEALLAHLREKGLAWREDESNQETDYVRNRLRHEIFPLIEKEVQPRAQEALVRFADQARRDRSYFQQELDQLEDQLFITPKQAARMRSQGKGPERVSARNALLLDSPYLRKEALRSLPHALSERLIYRVLQKVRPEGDKDLQVEQKDVAEILTLAQGEGSKWRPVCGMITLSDYDGIFFLSREKWARLQEDPLVQKQATIALPLDLLMKEGEGRLDWPQPSGRLFLKLREGTADTFRDHLSDPSFAYFPLAALQGAYLGRDRGGLRVKNFGGGEKPLRRLWNSDHIPVCLRRHYPLLMRGKEVLWIPGLIRSAHDPLDGPGKLVELEWRSKWTLI